MLAERSHKTFTTLVMAATAATIVFYSEQVGANGQTAQEEKLKALGLTDRTTSTIYTTAPEGFCLAH
jgi:hypothetical protein